MAPTLVVIALILFAIFGRSLISAAIDALFNSGHDAITNTRANRRRSGAQLSTSLAPQAAIDALRATATVVPGATVQIDGLSATLIVPGIGEATVIASPYGASSVLSVIPGPGASADHAVRLRSAALAAVRTADSGARLK